MNTDNYEQFGDARPGSTTQYHEVYPFTLDPSDTGFYVAIRDNGTCIAISRLRVYHYNCPSRQEGLVSYPDVPAPAYGSVSINVKCVDNAVLSGSPQVTCRSDGTWGPENPVCKCCRGYDERQGECVLRKLSRTAVVGFLYVYNFIDVSDNAFWPWGCLHATRKHNRSCLFRSLSMQAFN